MGMQQLPSGKWKVQIRRNQRAGARGVYETFDTWAEADEFHNKWQHQIDKGDNPSYNKLAETTVADVLRWYRDEVAPGRKGWKFECDRIRAYLREPWSRMSLAGNVPAALHDWARKREKEVKAATVDRDLTQVSLIFTKAVTRHFLVPYVNPVSMVERPRGADIRRDVTWTADDLDLFLDYYQFDPEAKPTTMEAYTPWFLLLLRHTGLRSVNAHQIGPSRFDLSVPCIRYEADEVKNGHKWDCPLNAEAVAIIGKLLEHRGDCPRLIPTALRSLGTFYRNARNELAKTHPHVSGLRMHDLRHTWTTELWDELPAQFKDTPTLLKITGREDVKSLARYINPTAAQLSQKMKGVGAGKPSALARRPRLKLVSNG